MLLTCPSCGHRAEVPDAQLPPPGTRARCPACQGAFVFTPQGLALADADATPPRGTDPVEGTTWRVRTVHGEQEGLSDAAVREMIRKGSLVEEDEVAPPGQVRWTRAGDVKDLGRYFRLRRSAETPAGQPAPQLLGLPCGRHPRATATWTCPRCPAAWCEACVVTKDIATVRGVRTCPSCGEACKLAGLPKTAPRFNEDLGGLFKVPVQGLGLLALAICGAGEVSLYMAANGGLYGLVGSIIVRCSLFAYLLFILRHAADGKTGLPDLGTVGNIWVDMVWPGLKGILVTLLVLLPLFAYQFFAMPAMGVFREAPVETVDGIDLNDPDLALTGEQKAAARELATLQEEYSEDFTAIVEQAAAHTAPEEEDAPVEGEEAPLSDEELARQLAEEGGWRLPSIMRTWKPVHLLAHAVLIVYALALLPILLIIVALFNTIAPALNPAVVFPILGEVKEEYAKLVLLVGGLFLAQAVVAGPMLEIPWVGYFVCGMVSYYFDFVTFLAMGRFARWMETQVDVS